MRRATRSALPIPKLPDGIMTQPELVIFDLDGTLVDSEIIAARVEADLLTEAGFPITGEELSVRYAGLTFKDIMLRIEEEAQFPLKATLIGEAETAGRSQAAGRGARDRRREGGDPVG